MRNTASTDSTYAYLEKIGKHALLTKQQEQDLSRAILGGQEAARQLQETPGLTRKDREDLERKIQEGEEAALHLYMSNLRLVVSVARRMSPSNALLLDFVQEGNIGLMRAVNKFDYSRDIKFSTYATWWIRQAIQSGQSRITSLVRIPSDAQLHLNNILQVKGDADNSPGPRATPDHIAKETRLPVSTVNMLLTNTLQPASIDKTISRDGSQMPISETLMADHTIEQEASQTALRQSLIRIIQQETDAEQAQVIIRYFGLRGEEPQSFNKIGEAMGMSSTRVRRRLRLGLDQLRAATQQWDKEEVLAALS